MKSTVEIIVIAALLFFAAITAASEIAIIAISKVKLRKRAAEGSKTAKLILAILETPEKFFSTILVLNNVVDTLIAALVTAICIRLLGEKGWGIVFATVVASFLIIVFEVPAKTLAARFSERLAFLLARPVKFMIALLSPAVKGLELITNVIVTLAGGQAKGKISLVTEDEVRALIKIGEEEGGLHKEKYKMLTKVFDFSETIVRSVMKLKDEIISIDINANLDAIMDKVLESGYSRLPVYRENPNNIVGIINVKDLLGLLANKGLIVLQDILYPPTFVSGSRKVIDLLKDFQKGHTHIVVVLDPKGVIEGLVTLEDILEEIVGEIEDEYDIRGTAKVIKKKPS